MCEQGTLIMKFNEINNTILVESINDAGIFKALLLAGLPGSGKSTMAKRLLLHCRVRPKIVNFDKFYEHLSIKLGVDIGPDATPEETQPLLARAEHLTREQLTHYIHNMLPIIIDGTAENPISMLNRIDMLHSIGYDIGMLWVRTDLETSITRAANRTRHVDPAYIHKLAHMEDHNIQYLSERIPTQGGGPFIVVDTKTDEGNVDTAIKQINKFFTSPISNPIGNKYVNMIRSGGGKSLSPHAYQRIDDVGMAVSKWTSKRR